MNINDAAKILSLTGTVSAKDIKQAYRKAALHYHPDKNPAGVEMMKLINAAFDVLKGATDDIFISAEQDGDNNNQQNYPHELNEALNAIITLDDLIIEICGAWVWLSGNTYKHKTIIKELGFKYASKKKHWYFRPDDYTSSSRGSYSMDDIRGKYGSKNPEKKQTKTLTSYH
jgi:curved DNA-binding protein CbpA